MIQVRTISAVLAVCPAAGEEVEVVCAWDFTLLRRYS